MGLSHRTGVDGCQYPIQTARVGATGKLMLSSLIKWYREIFRPLANWGRNKEESLKRLERIRSAVKTPSPLTARGSSSSSRGAE